jgi:hypothetical protein
VYAVTGSAIVIVALTALAAAPAASSSASPVRTLRASITPASSPAMTAPGSVRGTFRATLRTMRVGAVLTWRLEYRGAKRLSARIHLGHAPSPGPALLQLCSPCPRKIARTTFVPPQLLPRLLAGGTYISLATRKSPLGLAHGQIRMARA